MSNKTKKQGTGAKEAKKPVAVTAEGTTENIAIIRVRGMANIDGEVLEALDNMRLRKPHVCVIMKKTPSLLGMLQKAKDYITWGEINGITLKTLTEKRGEKSPDDPKKLKPFFRLHPPRKGFERKGIKTSFANGGALGYRGTKINDLIMRMM